MPIPLAFLAKPLYGWIAAGVAVAVAGVVIVVLWSRLEAKDAQITSLTEQLGMAAADVGRWQDKAAERKGIIDRQAATIRRLESDGETARALAAEKAERDRERITTLQQQLSRWKDAAHARPEDVRELGSVVRDALPSLQH